MTHKTSSEKFGSDILYGAKEIAAFIGGSEQRRRAVYSLVQQGRIPHFRLGVIICARKSVLLDWVAAQETSTRVGGVEPHPAT
jgi:hypothetical protein